MEPDRRDGVSVDPLDQVLRCHVHDHLGLRRRSASASLSCPPLSSAELFHLLTTTLRLAAFNYWDPLHYLVHGKGLQTWEYSPEFAIRSYFYLLIHSGPAFMFKALGFEDKVCS